jgi:hypothetical protein
LVTGYTYHDYLSLALHRTAVWHMNKDPSLVNNAQVTLERWIEAGDPRTLVLWERWRSILAEKDWTQALALTQCGQQLRSASPAPTVLPEAARLEMPAQMRAWRDAKKLPSASRVDFKTWCAGGRFAPGTTARPHDPFKTRTTHDTG